LNISHLAAQAVTAALQNFSRLTVNAVSAGEQNPCIRFDFFQAIKCLTAAHTGHDHIHDNQIYFIPVLLENIDRLLAAQDRQHRITQFFQQFTADIEDHLLIIN
jgi:hypothetical protein